MYASVVASFPRPRQVLSCIGIDSPGLPSTMFAEYHACTAVDFSFGRLQSVSGLVAFDTLESIILDQNDVSERAGEKSGNIFRVGMFLDFVWRSGTTRTE